MGFLRSDHSAQTLCANMRECPAAKAFAERIEKKHNRARANSLLAVKLGRAVYWMLNRKTTFNPEVLK